MPLPSFGRTTRALASAAVALSVVYAQGAAAIEPTASVIEYYNASLNLFLATAYPDEAAKLDQGFGGKGWTRTGVTWNAWANPGDSSAAVPVCRFSGAPGTVPYSHFYTADANECAAVKQDPAWTFDAIAFYIDVPRNGTCKEGSTPVYRSFYPGAGASLSHQRFLPDLTMFERVAGSSIFDGLVMCSPLSSALGHYQNIVNNDQSAYGVSDKQHSARESIRLLAIRDA